MNAITKAGEGTLVALEPPLEKNGKEARVSVLDLLFRHLPIAIDGQVKKSLPDEECDRLSGLSGLPVDRIKEITENFLSNLSKLRDFFASNTLKWVYDSKGLYRKVRIYLHLIHRFAPIFDYKRANINLGVLQKLLRRIAFWPRISTQIAIVIFVTDKKDKDYIKNGPIIQANLRVLCNCSAYAFHRTRNILGINN